jgi:hypothetical protein
VNSGAESDEINVIGSYLKSMSHQEIAFNKFGNDAKTDSVALWLSVTLFCLFRPNLRFGGAAPHVFRGFALGNVWGAILAHKRAPPQTARIRENCTRRALRRGYRR